MKKGIFFIVIVVLLIVPIIVSCGGSPQPSEIIKLTWANFWGPTNYHSILVQMFCDEIKKQTNGRVEITHYPGGSLATGPKIADSVEQGIADIGISISSYTMGRFPATEIIELPHGYPSAYVSSKTVNDYIEKFKPAEWDKYHLMYIFAHGPSAILTTKKPINTLEDLKGMVIRSTGIGAKIMEALGARGNAASQADALELMSKGVVDGSYTPREVLKGWSQAEVVKYVTATDNIGSCAVAFVMMNKDKWNSLPNDIKDKFNQMSKDWQEKHAITWTAYDKEGMDYFFTFPDRKLITLTPAELQKFSAAAKPALDADLAAKKAKGLPTDEYETYIKDKVAEWTKKAPSEKDCLDWVKKNIPVPAPTTPAK